MVLEAGVRAYAALRAHLHTEKALRVEAYAAGKLVSHHDLYAPASDPHVVGSGVVYLSCTVVPCTPVHLLLPLRAPGPQGEELLQVALPLLEALPQDQTWVPQLPEIIEKLRVIGADGVDGYSLYLSLKDVNDPRVQGELEDMMEKMKRTES